QVAYSNNTIKNISLISTSEDIASFTTSTSSVTEFDRQAAWFQDILSRQEFIWLHTAESGYTGASQSPQLATGRLMRTNYGQEFIILVEIDQRLLDDQVKGISLSES